MMWKKIAHFLLNITVTMMEEMVLFSWKIAGFVENTHSAQSLLNKIDMV